MQTVRSLGPARSLGAVTVVFGALLAALVYPLFTVIAIVGLSRGTLTAAQTPFELLQAGVGFTLFAAGLIAMLGPPLVAIRRRGWPRLLPFVLLLPFYYVLVSIAAWRGLAELIIDPSRWNKTEHGLARTSRAGLLKGVASGPGRPARAGGRG